MKKFFILLFLLPCVCGPLAAQDNATSVQGGQTNWNGPWNSPQKKQKADYPHSISLSIGAWPLTYDRELFDFRGWGYDYWWDRPSGIHDLWPEANYTHYGRASTFGALTLTYDYRVLRWLSVNMSASYTGIYRDVFHYPDNRRTSAAAHYFHFMPGVDFVWLNKKYVELYSGFSAGYGFVHHSEDNYSFGVAAGQMTFIGIKVGKGRFYFVSEFGVGMKGIFTGGAGYRF